MNLEQVRKKLQAFHDQASRKGPSKLWKPAVGTQVIRILPNKFNEDYPFVELYFHFLFDKPVLSPITNGEPDPIQEMAAKLKATGNKQDFKEGAKLEPKMRVYVPVIVRGQEQEGVKYWGFGKEVYQELLSYIEDPDYGDISDLHSGRDLTIEVVAADKTGTGFSSTSVRIKPNTSPAVSGSKDDIQAVIESQVEIKSLFKEYTYEELYEKLSAFIDGDSQSEQPSAPASSQNAVVGTSLTRASNLKDVESQFGKLFSKK